MITVNRNERAGSQAVATTPRDAAAQTIAEALDFAAKRLRGDADALSALRAGSSEAHEYFRYGLALRVGEWLAAAGGPAEGIYFNTWGSGVDEVEDDPTSATSPLNLTVWVRRKTESLDELARELDLALTARYRQLLAPKVDGLRSLLNVEIVDDEEVARRGGESRVFSAPQARPQRVWPRSNV